jgi:hypothetical protein
MLMGSYLNASGKACLTALTDQKSNEPLQPWGSVVNYQANDIGQRWMMEQAQEDKSSRRRLPLTVFNDEKGRCKYIPTSSHSVGA